MAENSDPPIPVDNTAMVSASGSDQIDAPSTLTTQTADAGVDNPLQTLSGVQVQQQLAGPPIPPALPAAASTLIPSIPLLNASGLVDGHNAVDQGMSANEIALYDRQIRLWGKDAQEKIRTASVLLIGMKGLGNEIAKNLVLAGIGSLTIVEDQLVTEDLGAQFLVRDEDVGKNRAAAAQPRLQELNPRVKLFVNTQSVFELAMMPPFFQAFDVVIATDLTIDVLQPLNAACRLSLPPDPSTRLASTVCSDMFLPISPPIRS